MHTKSIRLLAIILMLLAFVSILLASCERPGSSPSSASANSKSSNGAKGTPGGGSGTKGPSSGGSTAHMGASTFVQSTVTVKKGSSLMLVDDSASTHIIQNGMWDSSGMAKPGKEKGAPTVSNVQFTAAGQSHTVGPFNTAGTFHLYCTIHQNMNLTVTVQ